MKRFAFFIVILACCSFAAANQPATNNIALSNNENRPVFFGVSFGPTVDWFAPTVDSLSRNAAKVGFIGGINFDVSLNKQRIIYFSTGLLFRYLQGELSFINEYHFNNIADMSTSLVLPAVRTYETMYLTVPTGVKFRTSPSKNCAFFGKLGFYHNFKVGGEQFDSFSFQDPNYSLTTEKVKNRDAALFAESVYVGLGFEYLLGNNARVFANVDYSCQFYYFSNSAKNDFTGMRFKSMVHSLHIVFGFKF
ncbi:MAG: PorT family protein [Bacteroidetes bacterium]|nr:PorT family protein [Bacteroidota bacterium]MCL2302959.1 PorT family protein [Lentimicrobiaceae bacterium]